MMSLQLNAEDLAKVRVTTSWGPFTETLFSLRVLQDRRPSALIDCWRRKVPSEVRQMAVPLLQLTPTGPLIDLHTVVGEASSIDEALGRLAGAPVHWLRTELEPRRARTVDAAPWERTWLRDLSKGDRRARRELTERFRDYHQRAVSPYWEGIRTHLAAERAHCARIMAEGGVDQLLATLHPKIRWRPPVLEVAVRPDASVSRSAPLCPPDGKLQLNGRSLVLIPSVFGLDGPHVLATMGDDTSPAVLTYPALRTTTDAVSLWSPEAAPDRRALAMLLGRTRTRALEAIADVCNTTELADRIGVSPATASHHASVLRGAGLITSRRNGSAVLHRLTPRGAALLDGSEPSPA